MPRIFSAFICILICCNITAQENNATDTAVQYVTTDKSGITIETRIAVEKEGAKAKIIFWQETENGFIFKGVNWKGDVSLTLDNGETLVLKDNNMKGSSIRLGGYVGGFYVPDLYQRFTAFYLSDEECNLLKQHSIRLISYSLDDKYNRQPQRLELSGKSEMLKSQLTAIGK